MVQNCVKGSSVIPCTSLTRLTTKICDEQEDPNLEKHTVQSATLVGLMWLRQESKNPLEEGKTHLAADILPRFLKRPTISKPTTGLESQLSTLPRTVHSELGFNKCLYVQ